MSKVQFGVLAALLGAILILQLVPIVDPARMQPTWEYMIESPPDATLMREINKSGEVGWELVFARRALNEGSGASYEFIYKRPRD